MKVVVCVKEVMDPDAVNNYAVAGRLEIGPDGKSLTQTAIPRLMNGFDEQAIEAALQLRDAGGEFDLQVVSVGGDADKMLKHAAALGANEVVAIEPDSADLDYHGVATLLATWIETSGGADLVLCGRQASDDDQGVVPALIGEQLQMPVVTIARKVELQEGQLRVTRVTPDGDEVVQAACPAVVTVSNEIGDPRYPAAAAKVKARRVKPTRVKPADLKLGESELQPRVMMTKQFVPEVQGHCEFLQGEPREVADELIRRLRADSIL
jgi:electron transfer flavoprotein beta subunit